MNILEVNGLTKIFGGLTAVNKVSFGIKKNGITGLIGPNGAGKTTIFNLITGIYSVSQGSILFQNNHIENCRPYKIAAGGITRTFQNIRLFKNLTTYENILTACHLKARYTLVESMLCGFLPTVLRQHTRCWKEEKVLQREAQNLMEVMGLGDRKDFKALNLPYGLQRRLEIARALALKPTLLLLDEPAAGMNPDETEKLRNLILHLRSLFDLTILLIEHHMDIIMGVCDDIVVLNFGCKLADGKPAKIQNDPAVKKAYLGEA